MIREKKAILPEIGEVTIRKKRGAAVLRLSISPIKGIILTIPSFFPYSGALTLIKLKKKWIKKVMARQAAEEKEISEGGKYVSVPCGKKELEAMREEARMVLTPLLEKFAKQYGFHYGRVSIKNNISNWGSCHVRGNINLNMRIIRLPDHLRDYVLLHELCHLIHPNHGSEFHSLLNNLCEGKEKHLHDELRKWRIR